MPQDFPQRAADADCATCPARTENIIIIGSEMEYVRSGFQLKLMFMACGYATASGTLRPRGWMPANRTTIGYVREGYNRWELLNLDYLRDTLGIRVVQISRVSDLTSLLRARGSGADRHNIRNLALYCHGLPNYLSLNYNGSGNRINVYAQDLTALPTDLFTSDGCIHSYACRTAAQGFGQRLANHFRVRVRAFKRRSNYGNVIRQRSEHETIAAQMRAARVGNEGQRIPLPPQHEAYPHPGLSAGTWIAAGGRAEGINDYALWRLNGAGTLPETGDSPTDQPAGMFTLEPSG